MTTKTPLLEFISLKKQETVKLFVVGFHLYDEMSQVVGSLKIEKDIMDKLNLENLKSYDIYLKLKSSISDCHTRAILTKVYEK